MTVSQGHVSFTMHAPDALLPTLGNNIVDYF